MWVFGYGSLMWDGWERRYCCRRRLPVNLDGHSRIFNKKSLKRWGTRALPGLTLNLTPSGGCQGVAFQFDDARRNDIEAYLCARETCDATEVPLRRADTTEIAALTYIYDGPRLIDEDLSLAECAAMILEAEGVAGSNYDYVKGVREHLAKRGVADPAVEVLWLAVEALRRPV